MQVTKNITLDLLETGSPVIIKAKQNDRNTRYIAAHLYVDGLAYPVPSGTEIAFRYKKPDGTAGFYDALPDNSPAITVSGNTVTVELVEQVLTVAGCVHCEINMYNAASEKLTTFTFEIAVEESVLTDAEIVSSDYYNVLTAEIAKALQAVTDATDQAENAAQSAQDAADSAAMSKDWAAGQPVTYSGTPVSIAYAGANRIAAITAYGETPQGGTTEAPVALAGVDSVHVCGRNLFPCVETSGVTNGITKTVNTDGSITLSGTATNRVVIFFVKRESHITLSKGTYTLGVGVVIPDGCAVVLGHYYEGKYISNLTGISAGASYRSFQVPNVTGSLEGYFEVRTGTAVNLTIYPMLNVGESPLPYEPYQGNVTQLPIPRPLHKVGDVRDVCRTRVKSVYDKRIVLDGTENWNISSSKPNSFLTPVSERIVNGLSDSYPTLKSPEIGTKNGIYLNYTADIIVTDLACSTVEEFKAHLSAHPLTVYYRSTAYDGTNGLDVCLTEYQTGFAELDGTETWDVYTGGGYNVYLGYTPAPGWTEANRDKGVSSHYEVGPYNASLKRIRGPGGANPVGTVQIVDSSFATVDKLKAWIAAQKAAGTPVQIAYQLATPETYATDPIDFDNAAGPLTVMTGGEVEVRMTELVGSRSPELTGKMDRTVYAQVGNPNLLDNSDFANPVNQREEGAYYANGYMIDRWINNGSAYNVAEHYMASGSPDGTKYIFQPLELSKVAKTGDSLTASANINSETISVSAKITTAKGASDVVSTSDGKASIGFSWNPADDRMYFRINDLIESGAVFLNWAKLEKGSVATPYVPKGYGAELAECMRYYQKIAFSVGQDRSTYKYIPTLIPMRVAPTCTLQQISSSGVQPTISTSNLYITANLVAPQYFDGFAYLSADL